MASAVSRRIRVRFSRLPPYPSVRWLVTGLRKLWREVVVAGVDLHPVKPCFAGGLAELGGDGMDLLLGGGGALKQQKNDVKLSKQLRRCPEYGIIH